MTSGGRSFSKRVDVPKGDPRDPMTEEEIAIKFNALGGEVVGAARCREARSVIMGLEQEAKMERLLGLLVEP